MKKKQWKMEQKLDVEWSNMMEKMLQYLEMEKSDIEKWRSVTDGEADGDHYGCFGESSSPYFSKIYSPWLMETIL